MIAMHHAAGIGAGASADFAPKPRVLLVEDQPLLRWMAAEILAEAGYQVTEAEDGASAFVLLVRERFDLLVTDIDLGEGPDGFALSRYAVLAHPGLPVVYASGRATVDPEQSAPGALVVAKPYAPHELMSTAQKALDKAKERAIRRLV